MKIRIDTPADIAADTGILPASSSLYDKIVHALKGVNDPELPVNIYDLGLIYTLDINDKNEVSINMTLTAPNCPVAGEMPQMVAAAVRSVPQVADVQVKLVWEPKWDKSRLSEAAKLELGLF